MWPLTAQERQAALFAALALIAGVSFKLIFFVVPPAQSSLQVLDAVRYRPKVDINTAGYQELLSVPHIGPSGAARIIAYRQAHGRISGTADLARALKKKPESAAKFAGAFKW